MKYMIKKQEQTYPHSLHPGHGPEGPESSEGPHGLEGLDPAGPQQRGREVDQGHLHPRLV